MHVHFNSGVLKNSKQIPITVALAEVQNYLCRTEWVALVDVPVFNYKVVLVLGTDHSEIARMPNLEFSADNEGGILKLSQDKEKHVLDRIALDFGAT